VHGIYFESGIAPKHGFCFLVCESRKMYSRFQLTVEITEQQFSSFPSGRPKMPIENRVPAANGRLTMIFFRKLC